MHSKEEVKQQMFDKIVQWQQSGLTQKASVPAGFSQHNPKKIKSLSVKPRRTKEFQI
jgi:response regulator of citrate/malate metabolism